MSDAPNDLKFYELTRAQIQHEDSLINNRLTWLLTLQAFLFGAYGFSLSAESNEKANLNLINNARVGFAWMAFLSSIALLMGVMAAALSMRSLVNHWDTRLQRRRIDGKNGYPQIIGRAVPYLNIWGGLFPTYALPFFSAGVWAWLVRDQPSVKWGFLLVTVVAAGGIVILRKQDAKRADVAAENERVGPMANSAKPDVSTAHRLFRERMVQEDQLIHYRTSWAIWIQAIFIALFGALVTQKVVKDSCGTADERVFKVLMYGLCAVGILFAVATFLSIAAALLEMRRLNKIFNGLYSDEVKDAPWLPSLNGAPRLHFVGHTVDTGGPIIILLVWLFLFAHAYGFCH